MGGIARFLLSTALQSRAGGGFPVGTLIVNITGSLLLGFLLRYTLATPAIGADLRAMLTTGFCGGYTTFSTFSYETMALIESADYRRATIYASASLVLTLAATAAGFMGARAVLALRQGL
jgi:CrcB protein